MGKILMITNSLFAVKGTCAICREEKIVEFTAMIKPGISFSLCRDCRETVISNNHGTLTKTTWLAESLAE